MLLTVRYILKNAEGTIIGAELQNNGKVVQCKTEEIERKRKGIRFLNATIDADGFIHSKDVNKPLKEKVVGSIGSSRYKQGKGKPKQVTVKLR